jgi:ATP-dependent DNA helicase RecG
MTATPIPRTLALSYFADFDVSVIDELPPGRQPIETKWIKPKDAAKAYEFVRKEISAGRQAYVVVPQVEGDGLVDVKSVAKELKRLSDGPLHGLRLAPLHGQMSADEKQATMSAFRAREVDVLVATTVIEVGIDIPNATVMLIDNADRFGLSQLHQLRGRVGRGEHTSYCLLLAGRRHGERRGAAQGNDAHDGRFEIAELDLQLAGPGQFFGTRQHGLPEFKMADLTQELALLQLAREDALGILERDPKLSRHRCHHGLRCGASRAVRRHAAAGAGGMTFIPLHTSVLSSQSVGPEDDDPDATDAIAATSTISRREILGTLGERVNGGRRQDRPPLPRRC